MKNKDKGKKVKVEDVYWEGNDLIVKYKDGSEVKYYNALLKHIPVKRYNSTIEQKVIKGEI